MRLVKFTVEKYRSILSKSELPIGDYTAILGPNNQGKSNLLRGLSVALRIIQMAIDYPFSHGRNFVRAIRYRYMMKELYDWETDYPIQQQKSKVVANGLRRASIFTLDFSVDDADKNEIEQKIGVKLINGIVSIKLELGRDSFKANVVGQRNRLKDELKMSIIKYLIGGINICYIDAERTAETALRNISELIELPIRKQFEGEAFNEFINKLQAQQEKVLQEISNTLKNSLQEFLPSIKNSKIQIDRQGFHLLSPSSMNSDIFIDDGVETSLRQKGSGVQSLIAISIAHYISQSKKRGSGNLILAIEEPETHLHPKAIHQVKDTLQTISQKTPVIITTHSPLLVNLKNVESNIIVKDNEACPAKIIRDIRKALGVQRYDNLTNAECAILVEGLSDERILEAVLRENSPTIAASLNEGRLCICNAQGCSKMNSIIATLRMDLCKFHIVLDHDSAAIKTYEQLVRECDVDRFQITMLNAKPDVTKKNIKPDMTNGKVVTDASKKSVKSDDLTETELEDTVNATVYLGFLKNKYALPDESVLPRKFRAKKWSDRMRLLYSQSGGEWSQEIEDDFKTIVANEVVKNPKGAIRNECITLYMSLTKRIEKMLEN